MIKIAVCDDEAHFRKQIIKTLTDYMCEKDDVYEIDEFESGMDFIKLGLEIVRYQIVFMDINMDDMDGIETSRKIREISSDIFIVFVTAFINYTLEGYKVDAVRYILKGDAKFPELVYECMDAISRKMSCSVKRITFDFNEGTRKISPDRLIYIESRLHRLEFHIVGDEPAGYTMYGTLDGMENELEGNDFVRIHQSFLVNLRHIVRVSRYETVLDDGTVLVIPKARYRHVEEAFVAFKGEL